MLLPCCKCLQHHLPFKNPLSIKQCYKASLLGLIYKRSFKLPINEDLCRQVFQIQFQEASEYCEIYREYSSTPFLGELGAAAAGGWARPGVGFSVSR